MQQVRACSAALWVWPAHVSEWGCAVILGPGHPATPLSGAPSGGAGAAVTHNPNLARAPRLPVTARSYPCIQRLLHWLSFLSAAGQLGAARGRAGPPAPAVSCLGSLVGRRRLHWLSSPPLLNANGSAHAPCYHFACCAVCRLPSLHMPCPSHLVPVTLPSTPNGSCTAKRPPRPPVSQAHVGHQELPQGAGAVRQDCRGGGGRGAPPRPAPDWWVEWVRVEWWRGGLEWAGGVFCRRRFCRFAAGPDCRVASLSAGLSGTSTAACCPSMCRMEQADGQPVDPRPQRADR